MGPGYFFPYLEEREPQTPEEQIAIWLALGAEDLRKH